MDFGESKIENKHAFPRLGADVRLPTSPPRPRQSRESDLEGRWDAFPIDPPFHDGFNWLLCVIVHPRPCHTRVRDVPGHGEGRKKGSAKRLKRASSRPYVKGLELLVSENASKTTVYRGTRILIPHANEAPFPASTRPPPPPPPCLLSSRDSSTEFRSVEFRRSVCSPACPMAKMGVKTWAKSLNRGEKFSTGWTIFMED